MRLSSLFYMFIIFNMKIIITGSTGLVGDALKNILNTHNHNEFLYLNSKNCNLLNEDITAQTFLNFKPDIVIHLASKVAGLYGNMNNNYKFLTDNIKINSNVLEACKISNAKRLINILSTCIFPDENVSYPLTSSQILQGPPHFSNIGYAYSKRLLYIGSKLLSDQNNIEIINLIPTNLYGNNDNYNLQNSHVIPALIHKCYLAKKNNTPLYILGSGNAKRQFLYAPDFAKIITSFIYIPLHQKFNSIIVSPPSDTEITIKSLVNLITQSLDFDGQIIYTNESLMDGQISKTTNNEELLPYMNCEFTNISLGVKNTINYFTSHFDCIRK